MPFYKTAVVRTFYKTAAVRTFYKTGVVRTFWKRQSVGHFANGSRLDILKATIGWTFSKQPPVGHFENDNRFDIDVQTLAFGGSVHGNFLEAAGVGMGALGAQGSPGKPTRTIFSIPTTIGGKHWDMTHLIICRSTGGGGAIGATQKLNPGAGSLNPDDKFFADAFLCWLKPFL